MLAHRNLARGLVRSILPEEEASNGGWEEKVHRFVGILAFSTKEFESTA